MTDERALRRAILRSPADDLPRLALADWYADQGRFKEEETLRWFLADPDYHQAVAIGHLIPWLPEADAVRWKFSGEICGVWHRGFGSAVRAPAAVLFRDGPRLFAEQPVTAVRVTDVLPDNDNTWPQRPWTFFGVATAFRDEERQQWPVDPGRGDAPAWLFDELRRDPHGLSWRDLSVECPPDDPACLWVDFVTEAEALAARDAAALRVLRKMADEYCVTVLGEEPLYGPSG